MNMIEVSESAGRTPAQTTSLRRRINVSTTSKGVLTWDCTVDGEGYSEQEMLAFSDSLVAALVLRCPPPGV